MIEAIGALGLGADDTDLVLGLNMARIVAPLEARTRAEGA